jgi:hypothetical protein
VATLTDCAKIAKRLSLFQDNIIERTNSRRNKPIALKVFGLKSKSSSVALSYFGHQLL